MCAHFQKVLDEQSEALWTKQWKQERKVRRLNQEVSNRNWKEDSRGGRDGIRKEEVMEQRGKALCSITEHQSASGEQGTVWAC